MIVTTILSPLVYLLNPRTCLNWFSFQLSHWSVSLLIVLVHQNGSSMRGRTVLIMIPLVSGTVLQIEWAREPVSCPSSSPCVFSWSCLFMSTQFLISLRSQHSHPHWGRRKLTLSLFSCVSQQAVPYGRSITVDTGQGCRRITPLLPGQVQQSHQCRSRLWALFSLPVKERQYLPTSLTRWESTVWGKLSRMHCDVHMLLQV